MFHEGITIEFWALIVAISATGFAVWKFKKEFGKKNKLESAKFILDIYKLFREKPFKDISYRIGRDITKEEVFQIKDENDKRDLINYLSELEAASQLFLEGVLTKNQTYELLGSQILESLQVQAIKDLINEERNKPDQKDFFDQLEKAWKKIKKIQDKKLKKMGSSKIKVS